MINIDAIKAKLDRLRLADVSRKIFGANEHMYVMNPCATEKQLSGFEERHEITLPEEYRMFMASVGNGGAGPHYGLFGLGQFGDCEIGDLSQPFPHSTYWNVKEESFSSMIEHKLKGNDLSAAFEDWYFDSKHINGALPIVHEGCGYFDLLVITGPCSGTIWLDGRCSDGGIGPFLDHRKQPHGFESWYNEWLGVSLYQTGGLAHA